MHGREIGKPFGARVFVVKKLKRVYSGCDSESVVMRADADLPRVP